jgi:hypothetical protein
MLELLRISWPSALAAGVLVTTLASGCADEPPAYLPESGVWSYAPLGVVSDTCGAGYGSLDLSSFLLNHDEGRTFQVVVGESIVSCDMIGAEFTCSDYLVTTLDLSPDLAAVLRWRVTWEGEFASETEAAGREVMRVTCTGEACNQVTDLPCSRTTNFNAMAL